LLKGGLFASLHSTSNSDVGAKLVEGTLSDETAVVDDANVGAKAFHDFQDVRSQEDSNAARDHSLEHGFQRA
jgi:hypothetical protein